MAHPNKLPQPIVNYEKILSEVVVGNVRLTPQQIARFLAITDMNGKKITDSNHLMYQILTQGMFYINNFDYYLEVLEHCPTFDDKILNPLSFSKYKNNYEGDLDRQRRNTTVITGIVDCPRCKSKLTTSVQVQTSSGDEATRLFSRCFNCNTRWSS